MQRQGAGPALQRVVLPRRVLAKEAIGQPLEGHLGGRTLVLLYETFFVRPTHPLAQRKEALGANLKLFSSNCYLERDFRTHFAERISYCHTNARASEQLAGSVSYAAY